MFWCLIWGLVASVGLAGTWVSVNSLRLASGVASDVRSLLATSEPPRLNLERLEQLPAPVRDYLRQALGPEPQPVESVRAALVGRLWNYRRVNGLLVPHHFVGYWHVDGQRIPYVDFLLETPQYNVREPFG